MLTDPLMVPFVTVRTVAEAPSPGHVFSPEKCVEFWADHIATRPDHDPDKEHLYVLALDVKYQLKGVTLVSMGTLNESLAHPREVFRPAIAMGAYAIILMHNHPSGNPQPSEADRNLTRRMTEAGNILHLKLKDHVIFGTRTAHFSFHDCGLIS
jgi:DNA repair protein RadC